jgi:MFS family permease
MVTNTRGEGPHAVNRGLARVIVAAALGTVFEWYDFFLYGSLAPTISRQFFSAVNETTGFILALLAFAAGFAVRPLGAIIFGRLGDMAGRKFTFLVTISLMGLATALVTLVAASGDMYRGLWYPVGLCLLSAGVGMLFLPETRGRPEALSVGIAADSVV